jgi:hypothetical protein
VSPGTLEYLADFECNRTNNRRNDGTPKRYEPDKHKLHQWIVDATLIMDILPVELRDGFTEAFGIRAGNLVNGT